MENIVQGLYSKNSKRQHFHRDKLQQLTANEHRALWETNQSCSMLAWGHGTTMRSPPGLCCDMAGQSGHKPSVFPLVCMCVHVRLCLNLCFPVTKCGFACDCACVHQQECFSCQVRVNSSCGQLCLLLSWQQITTRRDKMKGEGRTQEEDCQVGLNGIPRWSQYEKNNRDSRKTSHDPLLFEPLRKPFTRGHQDMNEYNGRAPSLNCHLTVVEEFEGPNDPRSYVVWGILPLVGSPMADWF